MSDHIIRVSLVEDAEEVRFSLKNNILQTADMTCAGDYADGETALAALSYEQTDIVVMDIGLPGMNGIECMFRIKQQRSDLRFLMLTVFDNDEHVFEALKAGADGYLLKSDPVEKMLQAIRELHEGGSPMSRAVALKVLQSFRPPQTKHADKILTPRETEILENLSKGLLYKEIAARLFISEGTVRQHVNHIYQKLHAQNRTEAINKYKSGLY
jgi:DNA-binding NarL/FixJ family response regulator